MATDRSNLLTDVFRVNCNDVRWYFIADYYDGPISGLAFFRSRLYRFCCFPEDIPKQHIYVLQDLTAAELMEELRIKAKFETLVGTHWSFDKEGNPLPCALKIAESQQRFYAEEKCDLSPAPGDRPIIAWFDIVRRGTRLSALW
jgi:hypothetical protein